MNQYNSYYLYQQYEKRGSQDWLPCYPNIFSVDGDGTMPLVMKKENDPDCGYTGDTQPIYRWYPLPITTDYICDECPVVQYRWENMNPSTDYYCDTTTYTKYYKQIRQYSYDSGTTWYDVTPPEYQQGSVYEQQSTDCGYVPPIEPQYRTTSGTPYCEGVDKYVEVYSQVSYDGGITWSTTATTPTLVEHNSVECGYIEPQYRTTSGTPYCSGETGYDKYIDIYSQVSYDGGITWETTATTTSLVETQSADCGFVPKLVATYRDGTTYQIACDENTTLTTGNTRNAGGSYTAMTNAVIGDCVTTIGRSAFTNCYSITSVTIPDSVTSIEFAAFSGCTGLTSIVIPDSVTSIGSSAFGSCTGLTSCTIGSGVTSIGASAFTDCSGLTSIAIPDSVTSIGNNAFYQCTGLTSCTIGSGVTSIGNYAFYMCRNLTGITIPTGVTSIGDRAFQYCSSLTSINIPSGSIGESAFYSCSDITSCTIGNSVTSIGRTAFQWCTDLTSVTVNATTPPTLGAGAFNEVGYNCKIIVPTCSLVNTYRSANVWHNYYDMIYAFDCPALTAIFNVTSTTTSTKIVHSTSSFTKMEVDGVEKSFGSTGYTFDITGEHTVKYYLNGTSVGASALRGCGSIASIDIPSGVTSIGDSAFTNCSGLISVTVEATTPPTLGSYALYFTNDCPVYVPCESIATYKSSWSYYSSRISGCTEQYRTTSGTPYCDGYDKYVDVYVEVSYDGGSTWESYSTTPTLVEHNSQDCGWTSQMKFYAEYSDSTTYSAACDSNTTLSQSNVRAGGDYSAMTSAYIGNDCVTSIGWAAFENCSSLTSIDIPTGVTGISMSAFYQCSSLTNIDIPNGVTGISDTTFARCTSLTSVTIPDSVTSIGRNAFGNCTSLTSVTIPDSVTSMDSQVFSDCTGLTSVNIPTGVTSIGDEAFNSCSSLTSIVIPSGVTSIGRLAFGICSSLTNVTVNATVPPTLGDSVFFGDYNFTIYVPAGSVETYKSASGWSDYASRIQAIP